MLKLRFNIANLLSIIFILGVGFAALRESSDLWESGLLTVTLGFLLISILLAVYCTESKRAYWIGFAVFGWGYMGLSMVPSIESRLITTKALAFLDSKVPGRTSGISASQILYSLLISPSHSVQAVDVITAGNQLAISNQGQVRLWDALTGNLLGGWSGTTENFVRIGHSLITLLVGWLGAQLSRRLSRASRHVEVSTTVAAGGNTS